MQSPDVIWPSFAKRASRFLLLVTLLLLPRLLFAQGSGDPETRVLLLVGDNRTVSVARALRHFEAAHPALSARVQFQLVAEADLEALRPRDLARVRLLLIDSHSPSTGAGKAQELKNQLITSLSARGDVLILGHSLTPRAEYDAMGARFDETLRAYWDAEGWRNVYGMLCHIVSSRLGLPVPVPAIERQLEEGFYHPNAREPRVFPDHKEFLAWYRSSGHLREGKPWVAVPFYGSIAYQEQTGIVDAVILELESRSLNALPVFGYPAERVWQRLLSDEQGRARVHAALAFNFRFAGPGAQSAVAKAGFPIFNLIKLFGRTEEDWRASPTGLSLFEGVFQVDVPELNGLLAPIVVGAETREFDSKLGLSVVRAEPISERVRMAVRRLERYLALQSKPNREKRIALLYYNYPPGKANIGASYLNSLRSIAFMLQRLRQEGYDVGGGPLTEAVITDNALRGGRNVGAYAPGELAALVEQGRGVLVPAARYDTFFQSLPEPFRDQLAGDWGRSPDANAGMWLQSKSGLQMVVPATFYGKIAVLPQPDRGFGQDLTKLYHSMDVTPPHHYAGVYRWLRDDYRADAVVHVGTHGTLEWLSGKSLGLSESDAPDVMIDELPNIYVYNVDVVGEGLVAKRRGGANLVDHMIPSLKKGGLYGEYAKLYELVNAYDAARTRDDRLAQRYADQVRASSQELGILRDLDIRASEGAFTPDEVALIQDYLLDLKNKQMPQGLHTFGQAPDQALRAGTVAAILEADKDANPLQRRKKAHDLDQRIVASGPREMNSWLVALRGGYVPVGTGNDPIRNPSSLPTGKNFYGVDPTKIPTQTAWELGVRLADEMIAEHRARSGSYPKKVAFVIWGNETIRNEGVSESQFFHLLGTRPRWDERGKVVGVEVVPRSKLGRPRIDVVISSAAEGMFGQLTELMDEAVQKINLLEEPDNFARAHTLANARKLAQKGYSDREALRRASVRIFDEPPGQYNLNVARIVQNSGSWDKETAVSNDYFHKMGHGFGNGFWGENMEDAFRLTLSGTEKVVHSASSSLYGTLDNDDFFMYAGGLVQAIRHLDGTSPELMVADLQNVGRERMTPLARYMGIEFKNRPMNPQWIQGMMREGYAGAHVMRDHVENLWGWQVTVPDAVGEEKWQEVFETYVLDQHELGLESFLEDASPFARQDMLARMLETVRKGHWDAAEDVRARLSEAYVASAKAHGMSCAAFVCQNPGLAEFTIEQARRAGVAEVDLQAFKARLEEATRQSLEEASAKMRDFVTSTATKHEARKEAVEAGPVSALSAVKGLLMQRQSSAADGAQAGENSLWRGIETSSALLVAAVLGFWRLRRRIRLKAMEGGAH